MAFLKVKRKCEEDPKEIFVLASKKHKLQDISDNVPIFQLASPAVKEENVNDIIVETIKNRSVKSPKCDLNKLRTRMRKDNAERIKENRYQMYAAIRELDDDTLEQRTVPVISVTSDGATEDGNQIEWVYDLYYSNADVNVAEMSLTESHFLANLPPLPFYDDVRSESEDEEVAEDEDDPNDENNWRNDYPDEESSDDGSGSDDSLSGRMRKTRIRSDNSLSSIDFDGFEFYEDNDYCDEVRGSSDSDD